MKRRLNLLKKDWVIVAFVAMVGVLCIYSSYQMEEEQASAVEAKKRVSVE